MAQFTEQTLIELNFSLQLNINSVTKENSELRSKLAEVTNKLCNYEGLTKNLAEMRDHLDKATTALLKKREETDQLRLRMNILTEDSNKKILFLQEKLDLLSARKLTQADFNSDILLVDLTNGSLVSADAENTDSSVNTTALSCKRKLKAEKDLRIFSHKPLARVGNKLLSRVRIGNNRKSISTEELSTTRNPKKAVLNAHLQMRGLRAPTNQVTANKPATGPLTRTNSSSSQTKEVTRKPFRC